MRVLVLGGSWFVGAAVVEQAVAAGHEVTVFNRGRTPARFPDGTRVIHGDRTNPGDLQALAAQGGWDAAVDVAGSVPALVRDAARALAPVVSQYAFVSTVSTYRDWPAEPVTESSPLHPGDPDAADAPPDVPDAIAYGMLKAGCEAAVAREFPASSIVIVRPGVVLGPGEYVGRVPWWLSRMQRGGRVLAHLDALSAGSSRSTCVIWPRSC
jgi:nucleoside-diphosphate-sugar epimerase